MDYMLLEIQDTTKVDGESTLKGFEKFIEVSSYSHGVSNPVQANVSNTGRTSGRPNFAELTVTKNLDSTTPLLNYNCAKAQDLGKVKLHLVRQDATGDGKVANAIDYMIYQMEKAIISSVSISGGGDTIPTETVTFNYSKITWTYNTQKKEIGANGAIAKTWNLETNTDT